MSNAAKFRAIPKPSDFPIPFKLDEDSLLSLLIDLTRLEATEACSQTLSLLQSLNEAQLPFKSRLVFLHLIHEYLKQYINGMEGCCWEAGFPLSSEESVYAELVVWNYLALAQGFCMSAESATKKTDTILSLAMALHSLGQAQLHIAATYSTPNEGFWNLLYQVFVWAEQRKLQHITIKNDYIKSLTINTLFARALIFQLCDTNQFHAKEMRTVFNFLPNVCVNLDITTHIDSHKGLCILDLKSDRPPLNVKTQVELGNHSIRYFSPLLVANAIEQVIEQDETWNGTLKSINNTLFSRVAKTLGLSQKRQSHRKVEQRSLFGVIGFEDIISFLYKANKNAVIELQQSITASHPLNLYADSTFVNGHMVMGKEIYLLQQKQSSAKDEIWGSNKNIIEIPTQKVSLKGITVYDSSANGYSVLWNRAYHKAKIGDLFGIISEDKKRLEIAIVRRIAVNPDKESNGNFRFGVEVLGFKSEIVYLSEAMHRKSGGWAIFIPGVELLNRSDALVYSLGQFKTGENVQIHKGNKIISAILAKEVRSTSAVSHVELIYPQDN